MSLFLGKIHYWLFNKIEWFESLENEVIELSNKNNIHSDELENLLEEKYHKPLPKKDLKDLIDEGNIHGWLQDKIHKAEGRMAWRTKFFLDNCEDGLERLKDLYSNQGRIASAEGKEKLVEVTPESLYNLLNDYILDGMPCDRANEVVSNTSNEITWKRRICVHKESWEKEGVDVTIFYDLRNEWIKSFIDNISKDYKFTKIDNTTFKIERA
ncbi:MAG: hypothetical protein ACRC7N_17640 [Clostridium sp.]